MRRVWIGALGLLWGCTARGPEAQVEACEAAPVAEVDEVEVVEACASPLACAWVVARQIARPDARGRVLLTVGEAYVGRGELTTAMTLAGEIGAEAWPRAELYTAIATSGPPDSAISREALAQASAAIDAVERGPRWMSSESFPTVRDKVALWTAEQHLAGGRLAAATEAVKAAAWRDEVPLLLAIAERQGKDASGRLATLQRAREAIGYDETWACIAVAEGYFAANRADEGYAMLRRALVYARENALDFHGRDRTCVGEVAAAYAASDWQLRAAGGQSRGVGRGTALRLARFRDVDAMDCARELLLTLARQGDVAGLTRIFAEREDLRTPGSAGLLALAARVRGDRRLAAEQRAAFLAGLGGVREPASRVEEVLGVASLHARAGLGPEALQLVAAATRMARRWQDVDERDVALREAAVVQAAAGRCDEAVALASEEEDPDYTLAQIAERCADPADFPAVLAARTGMRWADRRSELTAALAVRVELRAGLELAAEIEDAEARATVLLALDAAYVAAGDASLGPLVRRAGDVTTLTRE